MVGGRIAIGMALGLAASPCASAELHEDGKSGARRSGASVAAYVTMQLDARQVARPVAGLRLATVHDYRDAVAPTARVVRADTLDLRLTGPAPALYLAGRPVTGPEARLNAGEGGGGRLDTVMVAAAGVLAVAAAVVIGTSF